MINDSTSIFIPFPFICAKSFFLSYAKRKQQTGNCPYLCTSHRQGGCSRRQGSKSTPILLTDQMLTECNSRPAGCGIVATVKGYKRGWGVGGGGFGPSHVFCARNAICSKRSLPKNKAGGWFWPDANSTIMGGAPNAPTAMASFVLAFRFSFTPSEFISAIRFA